MNRPVGPQPFHVMAKPIGPRCNLDCTYCFYLDKESLYPGAERWQMSDELLETFVRDYIAAQPGEHVSFTFQGGEPTLLGVDFFRKVVELQRKHAVGRTIENGIQTNGTLLDDQWGEFLAGNDFLVGLSIDGPAPLHDAYRVDKQQVPTHRQVMRGLAFLQKHGVEFNTLSCIHARNVSHPHEIYDFLTGIGSRFLQFIPIVERTSASAPGRSRTILAPPPGPARPSAADSQASMTECSVPADTYGEFLCAVFDRWIASDVGRVFLQIADNALAGWLGLPAGVCYFQETCGRALAMEHNGDVFSCDHYVDPDHRLGNLMHTSLAALADSPKARKFGNDKRDRLPRFCRKCDVRFVCNGECPKHRFTRTPDGEWGLNYLCPAYKRFFHHIAPAMTTMADLLRRGRPAAEIMRMPADRRAVPPAD